MDARPSATLVRDMVIKQEIPVKTLLRKICFVTDANVGLNSVWKAGPYPTHVVAHAPSMVEIPFRVEYRYDPRRTFPLPGQRCVMAPIFLR
jgi:hypothetical protein